MGFFSLFLKNFLKLADLLTGSSCCSRSLIFNILVTFPIKPESAPDNAASLAVPLPSLKRESDTYFAPDISLALSTIAWNSSSEPIDEISADVIPRIMSSLSESLVGISTPHSVSETTPFILLFQLLEILRYKGDKEELLGRL